MRSNHISNDPVDPEHTELVKALAAMPRVGAPGDFDFRVNSAIARRKGSKGGYRIPVFAKYAVAAVVLLVVGFGLFAGGSIFDSPADVAQVPAAAMPAVAVPPDNAVAITTPPTITQEVAARADNASVTAAPVAVPNAGRRNTAADAARPSDEPSGGSFDSALEVSRKRVLPRGLDPDRVIRERPEGNKEPPPITLKDVFSLIGIDADLVDGVWTVRVSRGLAERSGVKSGDRIEGVDGKALGATASFKGSWSGRSLNVRRGGQSLTLPLANP